MQYLPRHAKRKRVCLIRDSLLRFSKDAPLELYCYLDNQLNQATKDSICNLKNDLIVDLTFSIENNQLDTIEFVRGFLFDDTGALTENIASFDILSKMLGRIQKNQLKSFKKHRTVIMESGLTLEDFALTLMRKCN